MELKLELVAHRDKRTLCNGSMVRYADWLRIKLSRLQVKTSLLDLKEAYEKETSNKITSQAAARTLKRIAGSSVRRFEQLYWLPYEINEPSTNGRGSNEPSQPIHSSHRYRFSIAYKGVQPMDGQVRAWGRTRSQFQVEYRMGKDMKLQAFKNRIVVMFHNPPGNTAQKQVIEAHKAAYLAILGFAKERSLILEGEFERKLNPHFVLENQQMNQEAQQALKPFAKEIEEQTGTLIMGDASHQGKIEHQGIKTQDKELKGQDIAKRFEWLVSRFPDDFAQLAGGIEAYNENLKLHISVQKAQLKTQEEQLKAMQELREAIRGMNK